MKGKSNASNGFENITAGNLADMWNEVIAMKAFLY